MDVVNGLLRVKLVRQASREAEMRGARQQFELATGALRRATELQQQRDRERREQEDKLFNDVCSRVVVVRDLTELKYEVDVMKDQAKSDAQAVSDAQAQRQTRRQEFEAATGSWRLAVRATQKFDDLARLEREEKARHEERVADLELEEHPARNVFSEAMDDSMEPA